MIEAMPSLPKRGGKIIGRFRKKEREKRDRKREWESTAGSVRAEPP